MLTKRSLTLSLLLISLFLSPSYGKDKHVLETYTGEVIRHASLATNTFKKEQWVKLDKLMESARKHKKRTSFGSPLLAIYYSGCISESFIKKKDPDAKWLEYKNKLDKWGKARPNSIAFVCLKIDFWTSYAWKARGDGFANEVTEQGMKLFSERLDKAEEIYNSTKKKYGAKIVPYPQFYASSLTVALGQGWQNKRAYEELVLPVIKSWPRYYRIYTKYAHRLRPQWNGHKDADYEFYISLKQIIGGKLGKEISAYCIFQNHGKSLNSFRYDLVDKKDMLDGMLEHIRRNPDDADLIKRIIEFSTRYDFKTTHQLLKDLRSITPVTFGQFENKFSYGKAIKAMMNTPKKSFQLEYYIRPESTSYIRPIRSVSTQDGVDHFVYAQGWDSLAVLRNKDCKILAIKKVKDTDPICYENVALSKSGEHIFVEVRHKRKRLFRIYTFKENKLELIKSVSVPKSLGFTEHAIFVEDDQTILIAGEHGGSNYKKALYFRWKWKTEKPQLIARSGRGEWNTRMTIIPDRKQVFCFSGNNLLYYNYAEKKPTVHIVKIKLGGEIPFIYDIHYAKEIDTLAIITQKDNCLALVDPKTFEVKSSKKLHGTHVFITLIDGYKYGDNEYTFCVSGNIGLTAIYHYNSQQKEPLSYESAWVNATYHASHLSVVEKEGETPRIIQAYYDGGIIGCYKVLKKK